MYRKLALCLGLIALLSGCKNTGDFGVKDTPQDMNVSPRSMDAYDPALRDLQDDDKDDKK